MLLVERVRRRKAVALVAYFISQSVWIPIALIPVFIGVPGSVAVSLLLLFIGLRGVANAFFNNTWLSWLRDLVPDSMLGRFFSRRQAAATMATAVVGLGAALYIDLWTDRAASEHLVLGYTLAYLVGAVALGWAAVGLMALIPEPRMLIPEGARPSLRKSLSAPFRDRDFRALINFLFLWNVAAHLAIPFFSIYMLKVLGLPLTAVIALGILSQLARVIFVRVWGPFADRFGSKVVLSLSASLFLLVFLGWVFTGAPDPHSLTWPLLIALHIFAGVATAGINLTDMTLRMKLAPKDQATAYLTGASLALNLGAGISPLIGGFLADFFSVRSLTFTLGWAEPGRIVNFAPIQLTGFDFLFATAFVLGLLTLNILAAVREEGEVDRQTVLNEMLGEARESFRGMSAVPGLGFVSYLPYSYLRRVPGMDVALGVTAYQLASSARSAVTAVRRGRNMVQDVADQVGNVVSYAMTQASDVGEFSERKAVEIARNATRGALHALDEMADDVEQVAKGAVLGSVKALSWAGIKPEDALRDSGYGVIQGAGEAGANVGQAAAQAVEAAREAAGELDLSEDAAAALMVQGVLSAARTLGPEALAEVEHALPQALLEAGGSQFGEVNDTLDKNS
jgi:MFS family permease